MAPLTTPSTSQGQHTEQQPLRRATYVHVSDLTSAYNIDHEQLEREMARVYAKRNNLRTISAAAASSDKNVLEKDRVVTEEASTSGVIGDGKNDAVAAPDEDTDIETTIGPVVPQKRLQPPRGGFNLCVLVGKINLVVDKRRVDQSRVRLAEVEIGDETGTVSLRARDEQIDLLERVSSKGEPGAVVLRNCTLELYQGKHIRLAVTKWGKLTEYPDNVASTPGPPQTMNTDRNFSFIDLSIVASEIVEKTQPESAPYTSNTTDNATATATATANTTSRQKTKQVESEARTDGSTSSPKTYTSTKTGQSNTKHQQQPQALRRHIRLSNNEQRHQARSTHYGGMKMDTNQPPSSGQMVYHGAQGYHGYGEQQNIDMRMRQQYPHAPYAHSHSTRQQDAVSVQVALHQQYEMQQRQLHQLYSREQNRHVGQVHQQQQPSSMYIRPLNSFDTSTGSYAGDMSMPGVGNSPILVPPPDQYSSPKMESRSGLQDGSHSATYPSLNTMSPYSIGKMNPEATTFAPSYLSAAQGSNPQQVTGVSCPPQFPSYDLSQQQPLPGASVYPPLQSGHHPSFYVPAGISPGPYHHAPPQATSFNDPLEQRHDAPRGKENVTSKP